MPISEREEISKNLNISYKKSCRVVVIRVSYFDSTDA